MFYKVEQNGYFGVLETRYIKSDKRPTEEQIRDSFGWTETSDFIKITVEEIEVWEFGG